MTGADWSRLGASPDRWAVFSNHRAFMRMHDGHCAALRIEAGFPARFVCEIYERRPQVCRELGRGSAACEGEIVRKRATAQART
ncbi:hypothetical protein LZG03_16960 [Opitutaceae bacterium LMO-CP1]|nr:hypothetical protein [Opitutaceae bacterium LMO-M01]